MNTASDQNSLSEAWRTGHPNSISVAQSGLADFLAGLPQGQVMGGPVREGKGVGPVLPQIADLFDAKLLTHKLVMGKTQDGMSAFANMPARTRDNKRQTSGLLDSLIRRI